MLFPAPLGPTTATKLPSGTLKETSSKAWYCPKRTASPWVSTAHIPITIAHFHLRRQAPLAQGPFGLT